MHTVHSKARRPRRATEGALFAALDELRSPVGAARSRTGLALGKAPPARGSTRAFVLAGLSTLSSSRYEDNVPALTSPNDHDDRLARAQAREHLEQRNVDLSNGYYWPAAQLLVWGEVQHGRHAEWQDLFYDCILVASAFQIGQFLSHNLKAVEGGLGLVGLGFTTITSWSDLTSYRARFRASSPYHRGLDAVEGLLTALAQHNIVADLAQFEKVNMVPSCSYPPACLAVPAFPPA
ncbi:hypothetical protein T492DRAFT_231717 [Pavlovales sp. CCMP2436]|nr:hypothetical protein T492DRAFT_231717 [Pavlovales sp. CCMP2436]